MLAALLVLTSDPVLALDLDYRSRSGLFISLDQISLSQGSFIQYYQPGWGKGFYSSNWNEQVISKSGSQVIVTLKSTDGKVDGTVRLVKTPKGFRAHYRLGWNAPEPCNVEVSFAHLWAPALEAGSVFVDGVEARRPSIRLAPGKDPKPRMFGSEGSGFVFDAPLARVSATVSGAKAYVFDSRGYDSDFSQNRELFWFGLSDLPTSKDKPAEFTVDWAITPKITESQHASVQVKAKVTDRSVVVSPNETKLPVVPKPKEMSIGKGKAFTWMSFENVRLTSMWAAPLAALGSRFDLGGYRPGAAGKMNIKAQDLGLPPGGYKLSVSDGILTVIGQDQEGVRNGLMRAVGLTSVESGELRIAPVEIRDWPSNGWRGLHMFVGPTANEFQGRMMRQLLAPMMFNQVVLQCERTRWDAIPGTEVGFSMKKSDLKQLFEQYRSVGINPTPLIQSFGHMEWLFQNNKNLDLALNPKVPYAIDPRKPRSQEVLSKIWKEAIELLHPQILHFGLDEVDMRGWPDDDDLVTELWSIQVKWLAQLAKENGKEMMIWGDQMLGPREAPDAALGDSKEAAAARRAAVPAGTWIADWHYINNDNPKIYTSLELFEKSGFKPVATSWNRPENIKGFFKAAESHGGAVLQSTWAGYESTELNMLRESSQFVAYLLAGEYAWSGRSERAKDLPYRADDLFRKLMYAKPAPLSGLRGQSLEWSPVGKATIGNYSFAIQKPIEAFFPLSAAGAKQPHETRLAFSEVPTQHMTFALSVQSPFDELTEVGQLRLTFKDGTARVFPIRYGQHVRAPKDGRLPMTAPSKGGISAVEIDLGKIHGGVTSVTLVATNPAAGIRLHAISAW